MKPYRILKTFLVVILLSYAMPVLTVHAQEQEQGFRWGKWSAGQKNNGSLMDKVLDSYIDSVGNTYIYGMFAMDARLGENGPKIYPMDTCAVEMGYMIGNSQGVFLAKIDSLGNILWCKSTRNGSSSCGIWNNMVVKDNKITIAFGNHFGFESWNWFYFFDTMLIEPSWQYHPDVLKTYFVTFDLDGNRLDYHSIQLFAYTDPDYLSYFNTSLNGFYTDRGCFLIDDDDNVHIFASGDFYGEDSLNKAYIIVDDDTNRKYPLNIKTQNGYTYSTSVYYRMDSDWNLIGSRFLIDRVSGWNPTGQCMANIAFKEATVVDNEIYASCIFYSDDYSFSIDSQSVRIYLDSVHYLRIDNTKDWETMPCLLKLNLDGEIVWVQQLYNEQTTSTPNNYMALGGVATDEENVYVLYKPSWVNSTRFYIDSAHSIGLPLVANINASGYCLVVSYNRITGSPIDYYLVDTINKNESSSLAILGDNLLLDVDYKYDLKKTELCKINKHTKEVTWSSPIQYNFLVESKNMSVNDHGWIFRGEMGDQPRVYDSIFLGNYQEASVMTLFYDSALDMHRPKPCSTVDSLWSDGTAGHTVTLSWSSQFAHPDYELAYIPVGGSWDAAAVLLIPDTTATVTLPDDQCHLFRVRGLCDGNRVAHSPWSDTITACPQVGISEVNSYSAISLYPNPTDGIVQIRGLPFESASVEILDMSGRLVRYFKNTSSFNISDVASGSYVVRIKMNRDNSETITDIKLVKR